MVMDIMVAVIFIGAIFLCMRRGFASTVINFIRCVASLVLGFLYCDDLASILVTNTEIEVWIYEKLQSMVTENLEIPLPAFLLENGIVSVTNSILTIFSFLLITVAVGLVASFLNRLFSKDHNRGFIGKVDGFLGILLGIFTGFFYVFLFLAIITPVTALFAPQLSQGLLESINESRIAIHLYENNLLLLVFQNFLK